MKKSSLSGLFSPDRIAVVGATPSEGSVGRAITSNLKDDFEGDVVAVNPNYDEVLGIEAYDSITDVHDVDLAVVVVPADVAVETVRNCGESGVKNVVVITAGFGESGSEGSKRQREIREIADEYGLNLVGPNSLGVMSTPVGMNATFGPESALPGSVSFMSQSGAFVTAALDWANDEGLGFKDVVSLGNKAVLDEVDFIDEWGDDPDTDVILGYLEGIGDGDEFIRTSREVTRDTPVVVVKSGRTEAGARAVSSHTGTLAGSDEAYEAGLDKAGVIRASNVEELFDFAQVLSGQPLPDGDGVGIVTNAGGPGVMATDAVGESSLELASFTDPTYERLGSELPDAANIYNPVDVLGDAPVGRFRKALDAVLDDGNVSACVVIACPTAVLSFDELADAVVEVQSEHGKPAVACLMGGEKTRSAEDSLQEAGVPSYFDPARGVTSLETLSEYRGITEREYDEPTEFDVDREKARDVLEQVRQRSENRLGVEAMPLLDAYGIPTPRGEVVENPDEAVGLARSIDGDVVMKIVSPDILHKSDIGGVKVGVSQDDVYDAFEDLVTRARNYQPDADVLGVQVQETVDTDAGVETIVGMNRDPQFGPLLMFGLGGVFVEVLEDTAFRVAPVSGTEADAMVRGIRSAPLLSGARGRDAVDTDGVVETVQRLSQLVTEFPAVLELDINPLLATPDGVSAVDLRLTVDEEKL